MENKVKLRNSINRSSQYNSVIETLVDRGGNKVFKAMYELLCFAAYIGVSNNNRLEIPTKFKEEPVAISLFDSNNLDRHFWTINLFASGDVAKFMDFNDCIETFEEYANGGMEVLSKRLSENPADGLGVETLMTMLQKVNATYQQKSGKQIRKITF